MLKTNNLFDICRYRVELAVSDCNDNAVFTAFDTDVTKLTNIRVADAVDIAV